MYSQHSVTQHRTRSKDELHLRERERKERAERREKGERCVYVRELRERFVRGGGEKERIRVKICEIWKQCLVCVVEVGGDNMRVRER